MGIKPTCRLLRHGKKVGHPPGAWSQRNLASIEKWRFNCPFRRPKGITKGITKPGKEKGLRENFSRNPLCVNKL
jgi:hypothetical protein